MGLIKIEGKDVSIDDDIINAGIPAIKAALSVDFPDVENADIQIVTPARAGAPRTASVVKRGTGKGINLTGSRSVPPTKGGTTTEHLEREALGVVKELERRNELTNQANVVLELVQTTCACGSEEPHPNSYWLVLAGGPFPTPEQALDALDDVSRQKADVLKHNEKLHKPLSGRDITGG